MSELGDMKLRVMDLMWSNFWGTFFMNFPRLKKRRLSMKWRVFTSKGRAFYVEAKDVATAEIVAKSCLKSGETVDGIGERGKELKGTKKQEKPEEEKPSGEAEGEEAEKAKGEMEKGLQEST